jgi:hypothetical protein
VHNVSEEHTASIFRAQGGGSMFHQNVVTRPLLRRRPPWTFITRFPNHVVGKTFITSFAHPHCRFVLESSQPLFSSNHVFHLPLIAHCNIYIGDSQPLPPPQDIHPEEGDSNDCRYAGKPSTIDDTYFSAPKLYI